MLMPCSKTFPKNKIYRYIISSIINVIFILFYPLSTQAVQSGSISVYDDFRDVNLAYQLCDINHPELLSYGYYENDGYELTYHFENEEYNEELHWIREFSDDKKKIKIWFFNNFLSSGYIMPSCKDITLRIPNSINNVSVSEFYRSAAVKAYDVDPNNKYFFSDDSAVYAKKSDNRMGHCCLSYAQYAPNEEYYILEGTQKIRFSAFEGNVYLKKLYIPKTVTDIEKWAFSDMVSIESIYFDSFDVNIDKEAFSDVYFPSKGPECDLICTATVYPNLKGNKFNWDKIPDVSYYEIYQKLSNGEYKLLKTTKSASCKLPALKKGKKYTFAVKPVAFIPAANYNAEEDEGRYTESFTIEGTMSEDVVVVGK